MTMFLAPYTAIADIDGSPLDAGFIYFGEFGKNPETHPIPVYWDADFAVPAAQPIRTRNGYPIRNGSPCKIYLKQAEHSLVVKNKNLSAVLVEMNNKGISSSLLVRPDGNTVETSLVEIDAALGTKASSEYVDNQLSLKAPQSTTYTKMEVDSALDTKAPRATTYSKSEVDTKFSAYVGGRKGYTTLALAQADQANLAVNTVVDVTNDPVAENNGTYQWNGTTLTKSAYDPLTLAKKYADSGLHDLAASQIGRKNLLNANDIRIGKSLSSTGGSILTTQVNPESTGISQFIAIKPDTYYTFSGVGPVRVSFFADAVDSSPCLLTSNAANPKTILSPSNAKYLVVNLKTPYEPQATTLQVEEGEEATAFVPYNKIDANLVYGLSAVIDQQFSNKFLINEGEAWEIY